MLSVVQHSVAAPFFVLFSRQCCVFEFRLLFFFLFLSLQSRSGPLGSRVWVPVDPRRKIVCPRLVQITLFLSLSLTHTTTCTISLSHTHTHTHTHSFSFTHTHTYTHSLFLFHTHSIFLSHTHTPLSSTNTNTFCISFHTLSHILIDI
jgi:hypothetical protein